RHLHRIRVRARLLDPLPGPVRRVRVGEPCRLRLELAFGGLSGLVLGGPFGLTVVPLRAPLRGLATLLGPALADRESVGEQDLVGGRPEVRAEMATRRVSEDGATQLLDSRGRLDRPHVAVSPRRRFAHPELALERARWARARDSAPRSPTSSGART